MPTKPKTTGAGRPTKLTPEVQATICETIAAGGTFRAACLRAGISHTTLYGWIERGRNGEAEYADFLAAIEKAEGNAITRNLAVINKAAHDGTWQAAAWWLERRYPQEYGRQVHEVQGKDGGPVAVEITVVENASHGALTTLPETG